jgi:hypothetical protein
VFAFNPTIVTCFDLSLKLDKSKGWNIAPIHMPNGIHLSVTLANYENVANKLAKDV